MLISIDFTNESYFDRAGNSDLTISIRILYHNQIKISVDIFKSGLDSDFVYRFRFIIRFWCIKFRIEKLKSRLNLDLQSALPALYLEFGSMRTAYQLK